MITSIKYDVTDFFDMCRLTFFDIPCIMGLWCDKFHSNTICDMGEKYREVVLFLPYKMVSKKPI